MFVSVEKSCKNRANPRISSRAFFPLTAATSPAYNRMHSTLMPTDISLILPLADAARQSTKTGSKAVNLSSLIAARFAVPRGFVIGADAYRSHLWATGLREVAGGAPEAEDREKIRAAILGLDIPEDIWSAIATSYQHLSWQSRPAGAQGRGEIVRAGRRRRAMRVSRGL